MGATYEVLLPGYGVGLVLLAVVATGALAFTLVGMRESATSVDSRRSPRSG